MVAARVALAGRIQRPIVFRILRIPDIDPALAREELAIPGVPRRHHAIEHVDAPRHALDEVFRRASAHQIPGLRVRQSVDDSLGNRIHLLAGFSDAEATNSVALEPDRDCGIDALTSQVLEDPTLDDTELRLSRVAHRHVVDRTRPKLQHAPPTALGPSDRPAHRARRRVVGGRERQALVQHHRDVRAETCLDVRGPLRREQIARAVQVGSKIGPLLGDGTPVGQTEHLVAAAVGQDWPIPTDEPMEPPAPSDQFVTGPQQQVIRVRQHDLRAGILQFGMTKGLHGALSPDGHECRRLKDPVRGLALAKTRGTIGGSHAEAERTHVKMISVKKLRVGVIYGGRSGEHEVSVASAASIFKHLDAERYEAIPIRIEKSGQWALGGRVPDARCAADVGTQRDSEALQLVDASAAVSRAGLDVVFPVLHGPYGEDGTVQGLLELAGIAYVGSGVLGSAVGMDKAVMKTLFAAHKLPIVAHLTVIHREWLRQPAEVADRAAATLRFPMFVKPANLGSSVGISKVKSSTDFARAMALAFQFDRKVVIEAGVLNAREIECAVLGNDEPEASIPGEILPSREFYDYEAKYLDKGSKLLIPAPLTPSQTAEIRRLAVEAFRAVEGAGMSRVDFLMAGDSSQTFVNEVNTIPGFTTISMYPKLWEASGLPYPALLDRLIALATERHRDKQALRTSVR